METLIYRGIYVRNGRVKSATNIYHVMLRGNNKNKIFFDSQDYAKFSDLLFGEVKKSISFCMPGVLCQIIFIC